MRFDINNRIPANSELSLTSINGRGCEINSEINREVEFVPAFIVVLVILSHLTLLLALDVVWEPTGLSVPTTTPPKLNAYIYYEQKETVKTVPLSVKQSDYKRPVESSETNEEQAVKIENSPPRDTVLTQVTRVDEANTDVADMGLINTIKTQQPAWLKKEKESVDAQAYFYSDVITPSTLSNSSLNTSNLNASSLNTSNLNTSNLNAWTQEYFSRERDAILGKLSVNAAARYTQVKTLSEMDGEMIELQLPVEDEWLSAKTLDHKLDPNRIVRQGNTCYRVVKTPNPINPHAENLGYPFRCDGDSVAAALKRAIAKRVYKRPIN